MAPTPNANAATKWADGLRGIASLLVVTAHISRSLAPCILSPAMSESLPPLILQLPIIRCLFMGRPSVAVFALLSGYVNALKPIKQTRAGHIEDALTGVAKSAFRRTGRFIIPAMIATTLSWLVCQFGGYGLAKEVESAWIRDTSPMPSGSFAAALRDLFNNLITTWTDGGNEYDRIQWTLCYLLRGSMLVYLTLVATAYVRPRYRMLIYTTLYLYYWKMGDAVVGINIYAGMLLAELTFDSDLQTHVSNHPTLYSVLSSLGILLGTFIISYPEEHPEWARWSNGLMEFGHYIFPAGSEYSRYYPALGAEILVFGIMFNSTAKRILSSSPLCWIGKMSFAVYLLHAPLIRTLLTWLLYGASAQPRSAGKDDHGNALPPDWIPLTSRWLLFVTLPLFYYLLYRIAQLWVMYIDPFCGRATNWIEEKLFRDDTRMEKPLLLA
ncbi:hypothetical protein MMC19_007625 [Ptychographa xylographoides]|nr:hypothetical protein [Ptychographa xylographoides]